MSTQPLPQPDSYTDAQLTDGTILRFNGQLGPDEVRQKVAAYRAKTQPANTTPAPAPDPGPDAQYASNPILRGVQNFSDAVLGTHTNQGVINGVTQGLPFLMRHPIQSGEMLLNSAGQAQQGTQQRAAEQLQQPGLSNKVQGVTRGAYGMLPFLGPMLEKGGQQFQQGDVAGGLGTTGAASLPFLAKPIAQGGAAAADAVNSLPGQLKNAIKNVADPNTVYHKYLDPVKDTPFDLPPMTPRVASALVKKVEINHPDIAARIQDGSTTIGDADQIRQVAWTAGKGAVNAVGRPTEMAGGFMKAHDAIADAMYPQIEQLHNLPAGSLGELKLSLGRLQNTKPILGRVAEVPGQSFGVPELLGQGLKPLTAATIPGRAVAKWGRYAIEGTRTARKSATLPAPQ